MHLTSQTHSPTDSFFNDILVRLFHDLEYYSEDAVSNDNRIYQALKTEFAVYDNGAWFDSLCRVAANSAEMPYSSHSDEVRLQIAKCTWLLFYIDDISHKIPHYITSFQSRLMVTEGGDCPNDKDNYFTIYRANLAEYYRLFDPISANCIILSSLEFMTGCVLEESPAIRDMEMTSEASRSWPDFLRRKTGYAHAYAYMLFPREVNLEASVYIQVIDDMADVMNLVNDVLSFYKEDLAGERNNYVYNRARVNQRSVKETLEEMVDESLAKHRRILSSLEITSAKALVLWKQFVNGYLEFHFSQDRYRLKELDLIL